MRCDELRFLGQRTVLFYSYGSFDGVFLGRIGKLHSHFHAREREREILLCKVSLYVNMDLALCLVNSIERHLLWGIAHVLRFLLDLSMPVLLNWSVREFRRMELGLP